MTRYSLPAPSSPQGHLPLQESSQPSYCARVSHLCQWVLCIAPRSSARTSNTIPAEHCPQGRWQQDLPAQLLCHPHLLPWVPGTGVCGAATTLPCPKHDPQPDEVLCVPMYRATTASSPDSPECPQRSPCPTAALKDPMCLWTSTVPALHPFSPRCLSGSSLHPESLSSAPPQLCSGFS